MGLPVDFYPLWLYSTFIAITTVSTIAAAAAGSTAEQLVCLFLQAQLLHNPYYHLKSWQENNAFREFLILIWTNSHIDSLEETNWQKGHKNDKKKKSMMNSCW